MTAAGAYREAIAIIAPAEVATNAALIARRAVEGRGIPDGDRMVVLREYAELLCALERLQLSGEGERRLAGLSRDERHDPSPDPMSGGLSDSLDTARDGRVELPPGPNGASTPEQEEASRPARPGAEGHQPKDKPGAGLPPGTTAPPGEAAATPPGRRPPGGPDGMAGSGANSSRRGRPVRGRQSEPGESHGPAAGQPTPGSSPVTLWALERGLRLSRVLTHLKRQHGDDFKNVSSTTDLYQLEGEQAERALVFLQAELEDWGDA